MDCLTLCDTVSRIKRFQWAGRWYASNKMYIRQVDRDWQRGNACFLGAWRALAGCGRCPGNDGVLGELKSLPRPACQGLRAPWMPQGSWVLSSQPAASYRRMLQNQVRWH